MYCNHEPKTVKVGDHRIFLCGINDITLNAIRQISKLDIFIGLDDEWEQYRRKVYTNPLYRQIYDKLMSTKTLENLIVIPIADGSTYEPLVQEIIHLLKKGMRIGFGCIAGHGRTGWLLGRLIQEIERLKGDKTIETVRKRWCQKAIESKSQYTSLGVNWEDYIDENIILNENFLSKLYLDRR